MLDSFRAGAARNAGPSTGRPTSGSRRKSAWRLSAIRCRRVQGEPYGWLPPPELHREPDLRQTFEDESATPHPCRTRAAVASPPTFPRNEAGLIGSYFLRLPAQDAGNYCRLRVPLVRLGLELAPARHRQTVVLRFPMVFGFTPFAADPALMLKPVKRRVQRYLLDLQLLAGYLLNA